jgi:hypothetical protein
LIILIHNSCLGTQSAWESRSNTVSAQYWRVYFICSLKILCITKGEPIELCSSKLDCIYARNFSAQFMSWFASDMFGTAKLRFEDNSSGMFKWGYDEI